MHTTLYDTEPIKTLFIMSCFISNYSCLFLKHFKKGASSMHSMENVQQTLMLSVKVYREPET